jgi:N-acetylmuramoyl-L-alanine amidase
MGRSRHGSQWGLRGRTRGSGAVSCCVLAVMAALLAVLVGSLGPAGAAPVDRPSGERGTGERAAPAAAPAAANLPVATDARLAGDESRTRFIVDVSHAVSLTAFTLADPYRVVIDLPQIVFQLPAKAGESGRGLVKAFRYGLVMPGGSRIVVDTKGPVRVDKTFVLDPVDSQPARVVVDLVSIDRESFMRNLALENRARRSAEPKRNERDSKVVDPRPLVMLDPGHGGIDNGTSAATGENEKDIVLAFALELRDKLEKSGKYRVAMTRSDDRFIPLADRVHVARAQNAALFISIHADALPKNEGEARGAAIYTLSETASDTQAARLAETENRADVIAGVDLSGEPDEVADILIDLAQRETKHFSMHFAKTLLGELKSSARMHKHPMKSAGFRVLKAPDVPSVLVELGYVTSPQDLKLLTSDTWRGKATNSIVQAVHTFFAKRIAGQAPVSAN